MSEPKIFITPGIREATVLQQQRIKEEISRLHERRIAQISSERDLEEWGALGEFSLISRKKFKPLKDLKVATKSKYESEEKTIQIKEVEEREEAATKFQNKNYELPKKTLLLLRESITLQDTVEQILKKVTSFFPDYSLADEALDFLLETTKGELKEKVQSAKDQLYHNFAREVKAGRNIQTETQQFSKQGLGEPTALRDLYRDITGTVRTAPVLFSELSNIFSFSQLKLVIQFLFHALGADLNSKGPSISRAELIKLVEDTKSLQAILGVYRFFQSRMNLICSQFAKNDLSLPATLHFESLAKEFVNLISGRYISSDNVLQLAKLLGLSHEVLAQIIVFTQMRDATRNTDLRLYKSTKHRSEVLEALIEALEELEDSLEEEEEEE